MRWFAALMTVLFGLFAVVQFNDPDGIAWILAYGYAALVCFFVLLRFPYYMSAMCGTVGFLYAFSVTAKALYQNYSAERLNEFGGLTIALGVMTFLAVVAIRDKRRGQLSPHSQTR